VRDGTRNQSAKMPASNGRRSEEMTTIDKSVVQVYKEATEITIDRGLDHDLLDQDHLGARTVSETENKTETAIETEIETETPTDAEI
jgi:hypothetical protein